MQDNTLRERYRQEIEGSAIRAVVGRFGRHREIDDLIAIAREAVYAELLDSRAANPHDLMRYAIRRAMCDCKDYVRTASRQDPARRPLIRPQAREPMAHVSIRLPARTLSRILSLYPAGSLSESLRRALEAAGE